MERLKKRPCFNALLLQMRQESLSRHRGFRLKYNPVHPVAILRPGFFGRQLQKPVALKSAVIASRVRSTKTDKFFNFFELRETDRRLKVGHAIVKSDVLVPIPAASLRKTQVFVRSATLGETVVAGDHHAAFA